MSPFWPLPNDPVAVSAIALACRERAAGRARRGRAMGTRVAAPGEDIGFPRGPFSLAFVGDLRRLDPPLPRRRRGLLAAGGRGRGHRPGARLRLLDGARRRLQPHRRAGQRRDRAASRRPSPPCTSWASESFPAAHLGYLARLYAEAGDLTRAGRTRGRGRRPSSTRPASGCTCPSCSASSPPTRSPAGTSRGGGGRPGRGRRGGDRAGGSGGPRPRRGRPRRAAGGVPARSTGARVLAEARADLPPSLATADTAAADALLGQ